MEGVDMPDPGPQMKPVHYHFIANTTRKIRMKEEAWQRPNRY